MDRNSIHFHREQLKSLFNPMWICADNHQVINAPSGMIAMPFPVLAIFPAAGINPSTNLVQVLDRVNPAPFYMSLRNLAENEASTLSALFPKIVGLHIPVDLDQ